MARKSVERSPPAKPAVATPPPATASDKKKRKEAPSPPPESNKRQPFQRYWSEADEIAILRGILNHQAETSTLPCQTGMAAFSDSIRMNLSMETSERQLTEKIRRLRNKYKKTASSGKPNNSAVHKLSHEIWGANNVEGDSANVTPRYTFFKHVVTTMGDCLPGSVKLEEVLDFADRSKATAVEEKLKKLWRRFDLAKKEASSVLMEALEKMG